MRQYLFIFILCSAKLMAQDDVIPSDSISTDRTTFIEDYDNQLNIKFDVSNEVENYYIPFEQGIANIRPNLGIRYALDFNYRFLSLRLGIRPKPSDESKENEGESTSFRIRIKLLFNRWNHRFEYNYIKGYYATNSDNLFNGISNNDSNRNIQFPNLVTSIFSGSALYKINDDYSLKATESQTEIQIKSAGSFMPKIDYRIYSLEGTDVFLNKMGEQIQRDKYNTYIGVNTIFNIGYYYTFVRDKNWYFNLFAIPGMGFDMYKNTEHINGETSDSYYRDFLMSFETGAGLGYNSKRYYFGGEITYRLTNEKYDRDRIQFYTTRNEFHVFFGYRFKAPKSVRKSVDVIEEKVPILNKGQDNEEEE